MIIDTKRKRIRYKSKARAQKYQGFFQVIPHPFLNTKEESALVTITRPQLVFFLFLGALVFLGLWLNYMLCLIIVSFLLTLFYVVSFLYKFYLIYEAQRSAAEIVIISEELERLDEHTLPTYTILAPLYREANVLEQLVNGLEALDYPKKKLDIKLLLEEDDLETLDKCKSLRLPPHFQMLILPRSYPRTKPKALNYGLLEARGKYLTIYDAEDLPESDQLKKAVIAFEKYGNDFFCFQAKLNYYNQRQNLLTAFFTTEYSFWFDLMLPGLTAARALIPLGGTSNHFKTQKLKEIGGWDSYNVCEDCDLGVRLSRRGYQTAILDSTTWEEANSKIWNWIRQRSHWVKGYIQTYLVHMRHPIRLHRELGWKRFWQFQLVIGGVPFHLLINPIFWLLLIVYFLTRWGFIEQLFPVWIFVLAFINFYFGNFVFVYLNVLGAMRRKYYSLVKVALLCPLYWVLMSIGAWKGLLQLVHSPHYWEKTIHGFWREAVEPLPVDFGIQRVPVSEEAVPSFNLQIDYPHLESTDPSGLLTEDLQEDPRNIGRHINSVTEKCP